MPKIIQESELILNSDGSIYHLNLLPTDIAHDIITVGDPDRVDEVAKRLDSIRITKHRREFKTVTGSVNGKDVSIISTGIGTDNIDIVFSELDALVNVDLLTRQIKKEHTALRFYRLGTSGALQANIAVDSTVISRYAVGLEGLMHYYVYNSKDANCNVISDLAQSKLNQSLPNIKPYATSCSSSLLSIYESLGKQGITVTATGFYGPQGREVIAKPRSSTFIDDLASLAFGDLQMTNLEMETAGIYGMAELLGHEAISFNAILANRADKQFSSNPKRTVNKLIDDFFQRFTS